MAIEKTFFRQVMGHFATGVTVVTTIGPEGPVGVTVNAFTSVSLNPPLVLICIDRSSQTIDIFRESKAFAVNILTDEQEEYSRCFSTRTLDRHGQFCTAAYHTVATGAPVLDTMLAFVDTRVVAEYPGGDHVIFLAQVVAMGTAERVLLLDEAGGESEVTYTREKELTAEEREPLPLLYYRGRYRQLADLALELTATGPETAPSHPPQA